MGQDTYPARRAARLLAGFAIAYFLLTVFWQGWTRAETDFPNYYTAAVLVRHGQHLRDFYDWTWFQRQMNYVGIERQLGAYTPQTPLTMLPIVPMAGFAPQTAKRIWLVLDLGFLAATVWLMSRLTGLGVEYVVLLLFAGYTSLRTNFLLGQYYVFLLFMLTLACYFFARGRHTATGIAAASAFALKLYGGPLVLCFAAKRRWRAVNGFVIVSVLAAAVAAAIFGWRDVYFYATQVLPRTLEGSSVNPYHPGNPTFSTLLRRLFVPDADLNPAPVWNAPSLFFFLHAFVCVAIVALTTLAAARNPTGGERRAFAMFTIALILVSASVASYTFIVLALPVALCINKERRFETVYLVASYALINAPLPYGAFFPKVWLIAALLIVTGWQHWRALSARAAAAIVACAALAAGLRAQHAMTNYRQEPAQRFEHIALKQESLFAAYPAIARSGMFFQSLGVDRYVLRWLHEGRLEELAFDGHAFRPAAPDPAGLIYFELAAHATSRMMQFDPATRKTSVSPMPVRLGSDGPAPSPDGKWVAFTASETGPSQVYLRSLATGRVVRVSGGDCNSWGPAWELDSSALVFGSDCGRAIGLPALYRAPVTDIH